MSLKNNDIQNNICSKDNCFFQQEKKEKTFFNSELLKILGVVYAIGSPLVIWLVVSAFQAQSDIKLLQSKQEIITEMRQDIRGIREDLTSIKIQLVKQDKDQTK